MSRSLLVDRPYQMPMASQNRTMNAVRQSSVLTYTPQPMSPYQTMRYGRRLMNRMAPMVAHARRGAW